MVTRGLAILAVLLGTSGVWAEDANAPGIKLLVRAAGTQNGVPARVYWKHKNVSYAIGDTGPDGIIQINMECEPGVYFAIIPKDSTYLVPEDQPCRPGEIVFELPRKRYSSFINTAKLNIPQLKNIAKIADLGKLPENLETALEKGDSSLVAQISTEVHARLQKHTGLINAEPYGVMALDAGARATGGTGLVLDETNQKDRFVLSYESVAAIKKFQEETGIDVSGKLDYKTLYALTGKDTASIYSRPVI